MKIVATKNSLPLSWLIRIVGGLKASHIAVEFDGCFILQSNFRGVVPELSPKFYSHQTVVDTVDIPLPLEIEDLLWKSIINVASFAEYDFGGLLYFGFCKLLGIKMKRNLWENPNKFMCHEVGMLVITHLEGIGYKIEIKLKNDISSMTPDSFIEALREAVKP